MTTPTPGHTLATSLRRGERLLEIPATKDIRLWLVRLADGQFRGEYGLAAVRNAFIGLIDGERAYEPAIVPDTGIIIGDLGKLKELGRGIQEITEVLQREDIDNER